MRWVEIHGGQRQSGLRSRHEPPPRRGRPDDDLDLLLRLRRRRIRRRRKPIGLIVAGAVVLLCAVVAGTGAAVYAFGPACDLGDLKPVAIGQNTFVYAADGSLLGAIPAERNRQPIRLSRMSRWLPKATVAIEDRRFSSTAVSTRPGSPEQCGRTSGRASWSKAGRRSRSSVRNLYISRERTVRRKLKEACLAIKLNEK